MILSQKIRVAGVICNVYFGIGNRSPSCFWLVHEGILQINKTEYKVLLPSRHSCFALLMLYLHGSLFHSQQKHF